MYIRSLTDEEKEMVVTAKKRANALLKTQRDGLLKEIEKFKRKNPNNGSFARNYTLQSLEDERNAIGYVTGNPVFFIIGLDSIMLDYDRVKKLDRLLNPRDWRRDAGIEVKNKKPPALVVNYFKDQKQAGVIGLNGLPEYQAAALTGLPFIEIEKY